jgi:hypothetical protein
LNGLQASLSSNEQPPFLWAMTAMWILANLSQFSLVYKGEQSKIHLTLPKVINIGFLLYRLNQDLDRAKFPVLTNVSQRGIIIRVKLGVIAQLVEHCNGIAGVSGSSPLSSIGWGTIN